MSKSTSESENEQTKTTEKSTSENLANEPAHILDKVPNKEEKMDKTNIPDEKSTADKAQEEQMSSDESDHKATSTAGPASSEETNKIEVALGTTQPIRKRGRKLLWFFTSVNFVALVVLFLAAYWYYTQIRNTENNDTSALLALEQSLTIKSQEQQASINRLSSQLSSLSNEQSGQTNNVSNALNEIRNLAENNADNIAQNNAALSKRLAELSGRRPSDWLLAEASYLINMAGRKVYLEQDFRTAITLLQEADARLVDLNDASLFPVRAHIASDIQTIRQINPVSTQSLALALGSMQDKVSELPLDVLQLPDLVNEEDPSLSKDISDWRANLAKTWRSIVDDFISIKHVEGPIEPYLSERQIWLVEQQIKHALAQAQTAVLNEHAELYKASTQTALSLLVNHYNLESPAVGQFIEALQDLQNTDFIKVLPTTLESQASLKDILEQRVQDLYNNNSRESFSSKLVPEETRSGELTSLTTETTL